MNKELIKIIIATGGTGGHVFPACSLAEHLITKKINVQLISDQRGMKYFKDYSHLNVIKITSSTISGGRFGSIGLSPCSSLSRISLCN